MYDEARDSAMELTSQAGYDDMEMRAFAGGNDGSPIDGSTSSGEDALGGVAGGHGMGMGLGMGGVGGTMNILGKPMATNNFVTKLYQ